MSNRWPGSNSYGMDNELKDMDSDNEIRIAKIRPTNILRLAEVVDDFQRSFANLCYRNIQAIPERRENLIDLQKKGNLLCDVVRRGPDEDYGDLSNYITFMENTNRLAALSLSSAPVPSDQLRAARKAFTASADVLAERLKPDIVTKFVGAVGMFLGAILALGTFFCCTTLAKNGYRMFTGHQSKTVNLFKESLIKNTEEVKPAARH